MNKLEKAKNEIKKRQISIRVIYSIPEKLIPKIDDEIIQAFENVGYMWYAQGYNFESGQRDLCFDKLI